MPESIRRPATAHDVARLAGVSQSAVSRTFTPGCSVAPKTREKVQAAAAALGYRPNLAARSLITRKSGLIAVVVPSMQNPFYAEILERLSTAFEAMDYRVLLFSTATSEDSDPILNEVLRHRVEALVMVSAALPSRFADECKQTGLPVVLVNRKNDSDAVSSVTSDNALGARAVADYLVASGHRSLAFIAGRESSSTSRDRERSFAARLSEHGYAAPMRESGAFDFQTAADATRRLLNSSTPPDGIFCANDLMAIAALNVAQECGMTPGTDISIVGFDDIGMASWPMIGLTTYRQPVELMVQKAVDIICSQLQEQTTPPVQAVFTGELIVRSSARRASPGSPEAAL